MSTTTSLRKIQDLKRRSWRRRDELDLEGAQAMLLEAIDLGLPSVESAQQNLANDVVASEDVRAIAAEVADCLGSLGGIRRRQADVLRIAGDEEGADRLFNEAIDAYDAGMRLEQDDRFRISNSYNLVQRAVVPVLRNGSVLEDGEVKERLHAIRCGD